MTHSVGIRELKNQTSRIFHEIRKHGSRFLITFRGQPIAVLQPLETVANDSNEASLADRQCRDDELSAAKALAREVTDAWTASESAVELIAQQRR